MIYPREESFGEINKSVYEKSSKKMLHFFKSYDIISDGLF